VDAVGNRSPAAGLDFGYDDEAPRLAAEWELADGAPVRLLLRAEDAPAGLAALEWSRPGGHWSPVPAGVALTLTHLDSAGVRRNIEVGLPVAGSAGASAAAATVPPGSLLLAAVDRVGNRSEMALAWPAPQDGAMEDAAAADDADGVADDEGGGR
jgi:hypothetical protein